VTVRVAALPGMQAVGIGHHEPHLVGRVRLKVEHAAREHVRRDEIPEFCW
jgi:hypothetical protein